MAVRRGKMALAPVRGRVGALLALTIAALCSVALVVLRAPPTELLGVPATVAFR
jgi:hypothetical protein